MRWHNPEGLRLAWSVGCALFAIGVVSTCCKSRKAWWSSLIYELIWALINLLKLINLWTKTRMPLMSETVMLWHMSVWLDPSCMYYADNTNALHCNFENNSLSLTCLAPLPSTSYWEYYFRTCLFSNVSTSRSVTQVYIPPRLYPYNTRPHIISAQAKYFTLLLESAQSAELSSWNPPNL